MPTISRLAIAAFAVATPLCATRSTATAQGGTPQYHVVGKIAVGKVGDGYYADFIIVDPQNRRLYGLGNTIVDVDQDKVIDSIPGKPAGGYALATD